MPFAHAARELGWLSRAPGGVLVSESGAGRLTEAAGAAYVAEQAAAVARLERQPTLEPAGPGLLQLSADGAMSSLVGKPWVAVKRLALGRVVQAANGTVRTTDLSYCSRRAEHTAFRRLALVETYRRTSTRCWPCAPSSVPIAGTRPGPRSVPASAPTPAHAAANSAPTGARLARLPAPPDRLPLPPPRRALRLRPSPHRRRPSQRRSSTVARPPPIPGSGASSRIGPLRPQKTDGHPRRSGGLVKRRPERYTVRHGQVAQLVRAPR